MSIILPLEDIRVQVCFNCNVFCPVITESIENTMFLKVFVGKHINHKVVITTLDELQSDGVFDPEYTCIAFHDYIQ